MYPYFSHWPIINDHLDVELEEDIGIGIQTTENTHCATGGPLTVRFQKVRILQ